MYWLVVILAVAGVSAADKASYIDYRVYRLQPQNSEQAEALKSLENSQFSFWTGVNKVNRPVDVMVAPHQRAQFIEFLEEHDITHTIAIDNVQGLIDGYASTRTEIKAKKGVEWTDYHDLDELYQWLDELASNNSNVKVVVGGQTYEGRDIKGVEIINGADLPGVIIEAGIHAREWIGPAATSWIINEILKTNSNSIFKQFNYMYFPSVNPDGYVYTWTKDRLWRKTRKPYKAGLLTCYGADPNRNFDYHWMEGGSSSNPCSEIYAGPEAFSEVETKSLTDFFTNISARYDLYLSYHSYSQLLMFPWGYTSQHAPLHDLWQRIGDKAAASLKAVHGTEFEVGNIYDTIYQASGSSLEWYYGNFNSTITYTYETRDTGRYGFVLPPEQIIPCAEEHLASLQTILEEYSAL